MRDRTTEEKLADALDALDHIIKTVGASRSQTRRLRWIAVRAKDGIDGNTRWQKADLPQFVDSAQKERLKRVKEKKDMGLAIAELSDLLRECNRHLIGEFGIRHPMVEANRAALGKHENRECN